MSVFSTLRDYLRALTRADEPETREPETKKVSSPAVKPAQRKSQGDTFDAGPRGSRVDLSGGLNVPLLELDEPRVEESFIEGNAFNASLDDLPLLVDEPLGEQPEFIPEGGMSTQSLMREFDVLDASLIVPPPAPVPTFFEAAALEESSFEPAPTVLPAPERVIEAPTPELAAEAGEREPRLAAEPEQLAATPAVEAKSLEQLTASPAVEAKTLEQLTASPAVEAKSLEQLTANPTAGAERAEPLTTGPAADAAELEPLGPELAARPATDSAQSESLAQRPDAESSKPERVAPAWLIKPTTVAPKPTVVPSGSEFNASLDDLAPEEPESPSTPPSGERES